MPDNNDLKRQSLARTAAQMVSREFTESIEVGGKVCAGVAGMLSESDLIEVAGTQEVKAKSVSVLASELAGAEYTEGDAVVYNGDADWQIRSFDTSPDGVFVTFLLMDGPLQ